VGGGAWGGGEDEDESGGNRSLQMLSPDKRAEEDAGRNRFSVWSMERRRNMALNGRLGCAGAAGEGEGDEGGRQERAKAEKDFAGVQQKLHAPP